MFRSRVRWLAVPVLAGLSLAACQQAEVAHEAVHPAEIEPVETLGVNRLTLTEQAIQRLDLRTTEVREQSVSRSDTPRLVVPISALIYDATGGTWIYTSPQPRTFIRERVDVDYIEDETVVLKEGPPAGTVVVSMATAELYGADFGVGH
jgi:hypothetical protein